MKSDSIDNIDLAGITSARGLFEAISEYKNRASTALAAAEEANRKANSESGFAFNAKQNAEEHAKVISQLRGTVEADLAWLASTKKEVQDASQVISGLKASAENESRQIAEAKATSTNESAATHAAKEKADALLASIEQAKSNAESASKTAMESEALVAKAKATSEAGATGIQELHSKTTTAAEHCEEAVGTIATSEAESKKLLGSITDIVAESKTTHDRVSKYETDLKQMNHDFTALHKKIEGLLPGATSAGLASAFRIQKERFNKPQRNWLLTFIGAIILLLISALVGLPDTARQERWDSILRHLVVRLPLMIPLVWLAIYAGRNYMLALRIQEEYAFKEAISTTFEGYKREMAGISGNGDGPQPLLTLCESILRALGQRPGRIYEGRQEDMDITPFTPFVKAATTVASGKLGNPKKES